MKAVRIGDAGEIELVDVPRPQPGVDEVLVRVERTALCATDHKLASRGMEPPTIPGHEVVGRLEDGTLVGVHPDIGCGRCRHCRAGLETRCPDRVSVGVTRDGGLAEYVAVRRDHLVPLDGLTADRAPILEPLACSLHAVARLPVAPGRPALVVGAGVMGILNCWVLQAAGCVVAVSEPQPERRELATELGADVVLAPDEDPADGLGEPPQLGVVTAPNAAALQAALEHIGVGGAVHAFAGIPGGADVDVNAIHYRHLTLVGSTGSDPDDYERARNLVVSGRIDLTRLPVDELTLDEVPARLRGDRPTTRLKTLVDIGGTR